MKTLKQLFFILISACLLLLANSCDREWGNPFDDKSVIAPSDWAPQDFQVEDLSITEKKLSWTYGDRNIEGFKLDRKKGDEPWQEEFQTLNKEARSWNDTEIAPIPNLNYQYRLYAFAGKNSSAQKITAINADFPPPSDLTIIQNSITSVTLNWQVNSNGEEGFKLERKYETGDWVEVATTTGASWQDNSFELNTMVYYRVNAYYNQYTSAWAENTFDATLPPPENLSITANSATSVTLNWSYNLTGHDGFKIERKIDNGSWEMLEANLTPDQTIFNDDGLDLPMHEYTYRMCAFFGEFQSNFIVEMAQYIPSIGETYKGGIVFYLEGSGGGLVCAESDQSTSSQWGCYGSTIGGTGTGIGTGAANTAAIVAGCSEAGIAARICNDLVLNGYSDWFLPSKEELNLMYQNLKLAGIGGFADFYYWSSSEDAAYYAWLQNFFNGYQDFLNKYYYKRVRAVRAF